MIQPITLSATHMECRNLEDSFAVMTELLAFEKMSKEPGEATLKHPNSPWVLVLHEAGADAPAEADAQSLGRARAHHGGSRQSIRVS